jgi:serine/threonine protein kinase
MQSNNWIKQHVIYNYLKNRNLIGILLPETNVIKNNKLKIKYNINHDEYVLLKDQHELDGETKKKYLDKILASIYALHSSRILHRSLDLNSFVIIKDELYMTMGDRFSFHFQSKSYQKIKGKYCNLHKWCDLPFIPPELRQFKESLDSKDSKKDSKNDMIDYGMEVDIWNIGLIMFYLIFQSDLPKEIPTCDDLEEFYTDNKHKWINIPDGDIYIVIIKHMLTLTPESRITSYAAKNMAEIPKNMIYKNEDSLRETKVDYNIKMSIAYNIFLSNAYIHIDHTDNIKIPFNKLVYVIFNQYNLYKDVKKYIDVDYNVVELDELKGSGADNLLDRIIYTLSSNIAKNVEINYEKHVKNNELVSVISYEYKLLFILKVISEFILCDMSPSVKDYEKFNFTSEKEINMIISFILQSLPNQVQLL